MITTQCLQAADCPSNRLRLLCPYLLIARYKRGDKEQAASLAGEQ